MQTPREILADLWTLAGGDTSALSAVTLTGDEPQLPSSFRVAAAAQASIAAAGLAAGVEASGPHDFAVREPSASRQKHNPRPPHSIPRP